METWMKNESKLTKLWNVGVIWERIRLGHKVNFNPFPIYTKKEKVGRSKLIDIVVYVTSVELLHLSQSGKSMYVKLNSTQNKYIKAYISLADNGRKIVVHSNNKSMGELPDSFLSIEDLQGNP